MANLSTAIGQENEILQEEDISFGYDSSINNVITALNSFLSGSEKNIIIGGKVEPYQTGMNLKVSSLFAMNKSGKYCCIDTDSIYPVSVEESDVSQNRIDIVEIKSVLTGYDTQIRKFQDPNLDTQTSEQVDTKKKYAVEVKVKKGTAGSSVAPDTDSGYIKIAEVLIPSAVSAIQSSFIYNVTAIQSGEENASWTNEKDSTFNPGYVYDLLPKFYKAHLSDGTIKNSEIKSRMIDFGVGTDQTKGTIIPNGKSVYLHGSSFDNTNSVATMIEKLADISNELFKYSSDILSRYHFASVVAVAASTENVDLSTGGTKTIDGYSCTTGVAVLLKNQTNSKENGLYKVDTTWTRYPGYEVSDSTTIRNTLFAVTNGNTNSGKVYMCNNDLVVTGTDNITFSESILSSNGNGNTIMTRDSNGRSQVASPSNDNDIVNKGYLFGSIERNVTDKNSFYYKLMLMMYPVGSIYWSGNSTDPGTLFGGTWVQIKDRFIWAKGDSNTVNAVGGTSTVTLNTNQIPSHNHSISHTHSLNNGNTSTSGKIQTAGFRGISGTTSENGSHSHGVTDPGHYHPVGYYQAWGGSSNSAGITINTASCRMRNSRDGGAKFITDEDSKTNVSIDYNGSHSHTITPVGYLYGNTDQASDTSSGYTGLTQSHDNMPPYIIKYCWERTA